MKTLKRILIAFVLLIVVVFGIFLCVWRNEIATLSSLKLIRDRDDSHGDGAVYTMNVKGGFYLDDFIAQGGAKNDMELIEFITGKLTKGLMKLKIDPAKIGCASFTATDKSGDKLLGRNYDILGTNTCIVFTENDGERHSTISTVDLRFVGIDSKKNIDTFTDRISSLVAPYVPLDGINDAGVSCGINMSYQEGSVNQNTELPDITTTTFIRLILDYADDVEEAVEIAKSYDMHESANMGFHYIVADAYGNSAVLQWIDGNVDSDKDGSKRKLKVVYNDNDDMVGKYEAQYDNQVNTNFLLEPGYYNEESTKHGYDRYESIWNSLNEHNGIVENEKMAMDILASVGARKWYKNYDVSVTVHSVVYNMTDRSVMWVPNEHYDDENAYYRFSFEK